MYLEQFSHVIESTKGPFFAFCTICRCNVSISHVEKIDVSKLVQTNKHKENEKCVTNNKKWILVEKLKAIVLFMQSARLRRSF